MAENVPESELAVTIRGVVAELQSQSGAGVVSLDHFAFDRMPCTRRRLFAICRKYATAWGYEYRAAEYVPSGNRPFQRNHKRGRVDAPSMYVVRPKN